MRVLIASDKYKGSLTAVQVGRGVQRALERVLPDEVAYDLCPIADGGEGTTEAMITAMHGAWRSVTTVDAQGRSLEARYGLVRDEAIMEMSAASGLALVQDLPLQPEVASTYGAGLIFKDTILNSKFGVLIGIGGSATNDGGVGFAAALGYRFLDDQGRDLRPIPENLDRLARIIRPEGLTLPPVVVACDVDNPLLGERGATAVYGPQKGVRDVAWFEKRLERLADQAARDLGVDYRNVPGAGAAGGLGWGLMTFCGAQLISGFDWVAEQIGLESRLMKSDLVITGEGRLDAQTLCGKGPVGVARMARRHGKPVAAFAGVIESSEALQADFDLTVAIKPPEMAVTEAMSRAEELLETAVAGAAVEIRRLLGLAQAG